MMAEPGWYPDPADQRLIRWWDGTTWTSYQQPAPSATPLAPPPAMPPPMLSPPTLSPPAWSPAPASYQPEPRRHPRPALIVAMVLVLIVAIAVPVTLFVTRKSGPKYPAQWDARVAPIAAEVATLRKLSFKHPVQVNYLSQAAFEKKVGVSAQDQASSKAELNQLSASLRAVGLLGPHTDVAAALNATQTADVIAFYDPDTKQIYARQGAFTVYTRVTLAHELTHVLQDQNFDLVKLQNQADNSTTGSSDAFTALIEGDAVRIQNAYLAKQSKADQAEYAKLDAQFSNTAGQRTKNIPAIFDTELSAPYEFGPNILAVLTDTGGDAAINKAISGPTPTTRIYLDPTSVSTPPTSVPVPALLPGEKKITNAGSGNIAVDAFSLYLILAARLDPRTALRAADVLAGSSEVDYTKSNTTCFRDTFVGTSTRTTAYLAGVLATWAKLVPDVVIESKAAGSLTFHACDPGAKASAPPDARITQALDVAVARSQLTADLAKQAPNPKLAACVARVLIQQPDVYHAAATNASSLSAAEQAQVTRESVSAVGTCQQDMNAGLP